MLLAIDAGNTNVCFALFDQDSKKYSWRAYSDRRRTADDWGVWLFGLFEFHKLDKNLITDIIICSVVPDILSQLRHFCDKYFKKPCYIVGQEHVNIGIQSLIDHPGEEGADLMVNAVAAHTIFGGPLVVIDFGTATTFSYIDGNGNFCGVAIATGVNLSLKALYQAAASLPQIGIARPGKIIGTNTVESMQSGIFWGYLSMVEGMIQRIEHEKSGSRPLKVVATGGLGGFFAHETSLIHHYDADLTLKGLQIIFKRLKKLNEGHKKTYE